MKLAIHEAFKRYFMAEGFLSGEIFCCADSIFMNSKFSKQKKR